MEHPAAAYNSDRDEYLIVWEDYRATTQTVYGHIVTVQGQPVGADFAIPNPWSHIQFRPRVAYDSIRQQYAVLWAEQNEARLDLYLQLLSVSGQPVGDATLITPYLRHINGLDLAYNSRRGEYLVLWSDDNGPERPLARRVSTTGELLGTAPLVISASAYASLRVVYNPDADEYLMAWGIDNGTYGVDIIGKRVLNNPSTASGLETATGPVIPIASNRLGEQGLFFTATYNPTINEYLVAWPDTIDEQMSNNNNIYGVRLNGMSGAVIGATFPIYSAAGN